MTTSPVLCTSITSAMKVVSHNFIIVVLCTSDLVVLVQSTAIMYEYYQCYESGNCCDKIRVPEVYEYHNGYESGTRHHWYWHYVRVPKVLCKASFQRCG